MVKIINAYADENTLTKTFSDLANSMFGGNVAQQELIRQKANEAIRTNQNLPIAADAIVNGDTARAVQSALLAGIDPKNLGGYRQYYTTQQFGPRSEQAFAATMSVPGANYGNTIQGVEADLKNKRDINDMTTARTIAAENLRADNTPINVLVDGKPVVVSRAEAIRRGLTPVLGLQEVKGNTAQNVVPTMPQENVTAFIDAQPKGPGTVYNYITPDGKRGTTDGLIDLQTKQPLTQGSQVFKVQGTDMSAAGNFTPGDKEKQNLRTQLPRFQSILGLVDRIEGIVANDPSSVGATGNVRRIGQNAMDSLNNAATLFGGDAQQFQKKLDDVKAEILSNGKLDPKLFPALFNSNASDLVKLNTLLAYEAASALTGQSGRDLSNADVQRVYQITGDPSSWLEGPQQYLSGLRLIRGITQQRVKSIDDILKSNSVAPTGAQQPPAANTTQSPPRRKFNPETGTIE